MLLTDNNCPYQVNEASNICQGDILRGLDFKYLASDDDATAGFSFPFPYAVILSQACDLQQHYKNLEENIGKEGDEIKHDKVLDTILVCPAFAHEAVLTGTHIEGRNMAGFGNSASRKNAYTKLQRNDSFTRFHHLKKIDEMFPELVVDFKNFHTVPIEIIKNVYEDNYLVSLKKLYRERLSQRFTNYLSRIGLPDEV